VWLPPQEAGPLYDSYGALFNPKTKATIKNFSSVAEAAEFVLKKKQDPAVIAFGESHPQKAGTLTRSPLELFATQIVPTLIAHGYQDLVSEHLARHEVMGREIDYYYRTGKFGPNLEPHLADHTDRAGIVKMLEATRGKMKIHGANVICGPPTFGPEIEFSWDLCQPIFENRAEAITKNMIELTQQLLSQNRRVVIYGGAVHNNLSGDKSFSIHPALPEIVEVDLCTAEQLNKELIEFPNWHRWAPKNGVNLIQFESGRILLFAT
jgi:hypothetical protein